MIAPPPGSPKEVLRAFYEASASRRTPEQQKLVAAGLCIDCGTKRNSSYNRGGMKSAHCYDCERLRNRSIADYTQDSDAIRPDVAFKKILGYAQSDSGGPAHHSAPEMSSSVEQ